MTDKPTTLVIDLLFCRSMKNIATVEGNCRLDSDFRPRVQAPASEFKDHLLMSLRQIMLSDCSPNPLPMLAATHLVSSMDNTGFQSTHAVKLKKSGGTISFNHGPERHHAVLHTRFTLEVMHTRLYSHETARRGLGHVAQNMATILRALTGADPLAKFQISSFTSAQSASEIQDPFETCVDGHHMKDVWNSSRQVLQNQARSTGNGARFRKAFTARTSINGARLMGAFADSLPAEIGGKKDAVAFSSMPVRFTQPGSTRDNG
jgi:hypothetical protein